MALHTCISYTTPWLTLTPPSAFSDCQKSVKVSALNDLCLNFCDSFRKSKLMFVCISTGVLDGVHTTI